MKLRPLIRIDKILYQLVSATLNGKHFDGIETATVATNRKMFALNGDIKPLDNVQLGGGLDKITSIELYCLEGIYLFRLGEFENNPMWS